VKYGPRTVPHIDRLRAYVLKRGTIAAESDVAMCMNIQYFRSLLSVARILVDDELALKSIDEAEEAMTRHLKNDDRVQ
jgi:hypothetical protein